MEQEPEGRRYYPNSIEQSILVQNVKRYFSQPERSQERTKIANEVSEELLKYSPHWTHRTVRLWFNNNKHAFTGKAQPLEIPQSNSTPKYVNPKQRAPPAKPPPQQPYPPPYPNLPFQSQSNFQNIPVQSPIMQRPMPQQTQMQSNAQYYQQPPLDSYNNIPNKIENKPNVRALSLHLDKIMEAAVSSNEIEMPNLIKQFDEITAQIKTMNEIDMPYANFTLKKDRGLLKVPSAPDRTIFNFVSGDIDNSSGFGHVLPRGLTPDPFWRDQLFEDTPITSFDINYIDQYCAAFVHNASSTPQRSLSYSLNMASDSSIIWQTIPLKIQTKVESLAIDTVNQYSWLYSSGHLYRYGLTNDKSEINDFDLVPPMSYPTPIIQISDRTIIGFLSSNDLHLINPNLTRTIIKTPFLNSGFSTICPQENFIILSLTTTNSLHLFDITTQQTIRSFIGHNSQANFIKAIRNNKYLFISGSDDRTVKVWDSRQHCPVYSIVYPESVTAITSNENFVIVATSARESHIYVSDIRELQAYFGLRLEEYCVNGLNYYDTNDVDQLCMFAGASKDGSEDSLLFMNDDGSSRKYIFRKYKNFINFCM
ncbi:U5 small nuclear ribonucleoprotein [Histomonas meleagridis]|uniref:U5 small nuclear ribonucleoprotein 40 kDa protein n=1 Tax=Histomonas meleagridis TaxID=135588 RepID=UPI00355A332B|nr:U5 small nuclear ribonucleoprotein [Histomonas meleagridis]KAH0802087.1 U5 small nuclear ribonucleoprotein 40 kDa protein [Histomonas meleagridis]